MFYYVPNLLHPILQESKVVLRLLRRRFFKEKYEWKSCTTAMRRGKRREKEGR